MEIYCTNTPGGLKPNYDQDFNEKKKLKLGEVYLCEIKQVRNYKFHKKYFALLNLAYDNTKLDMPFDSYRKYLQIKAGYYNAYATPKGTFIDSKSISFSRMPETEFEQLFSRVLDKVIEDIGTTKEKIMRVLDFCN